MPCYNDKTASERGANVRVRFSMKTIAAFTAIFKTTNE